MAPSWVSVVVLGMWVACVFGNAIVSIEELEELGVRRNYGIKNNFCRLLAHKSVVINNKMYIDSGMAKFKVTLPNGTEAEVPDLNPYTVIIDMRNDFLVDSLPLTEVKRPNNVPALNRFVMWKDSSQENYYISGGHFFTAKYWNQSDYHVQDENIPGYNIWRFNVKDQEWSEQSFTTDTGVSPTRLISSADISLPELGISFAYGGYSSRRNRPNNAEDDRNLADNSMLIYNHKSNSIRNITDSSDPLGYWHGSLAHLPLGPHGLLVNLMGEAQTRGVNFTESSIDENRRDLMLDWKTVKLWDVEREEWYVQSTAFMNDEKPEPRSRFCTVLVRDKEAKTWDLWVYGGQNLLDPRQGVKDIWVLSMPTFMWVRIPETASQPIRTHNCQLFGSQLIVTGGYPPGYSVDPTHTCGDSRLLRIYDLNDGSWPGKFLANSRPYRQREEIATWVKGRREPMNPAGWASSRVEELFATEPVDPPPVSPDDSDDDDDNKEEGAKTSTSTIIGAAVGGALAMLIAILLLCCCGRDSHSHAITFGYHSSWLYKLRNRRGTQTVNSASSGYRSGLTEATMAELQKPGEYSELPHNSALRPGLGYVGQHRAPSPSYQRESSGYNYYPHSNGDIESGNPAEIATASRNFHQHSPTQPPHIVTALRPTGSHAHPPARSHSQGGYSSHSTENVAPSRADNLSPLSVTSDASVSRGSSVGDVGGANRKNAQRPPATSSLDERGNESGAETLGSRAMPEGVYHYGRDRI